ncbi:hypothetical protein [Enterobacter kobei]|uniref:Uncharacterized protein n=1 Tax=Enterobacter kobei TaxID=208224 RepID=A0AA86IPX8_9ENTR|nr:hypothetical protein [Enterobacter kobei]BCU55113.1 hypothetical protein ENKO_17070 [Enterobacter kobei]SIQ96332.1 hypothetical protein SAMN05444841_102605 [Enterobacter kobei]
MSAAELWDDDAFVRLMRDVIATPPDKDEAPVHLEAERNNPPISWQEFAGDFT